MKFKGIKFCINSLNNGYFNIKIDPNYLIKFLNSRFINFLYPTCLIKSLTFKKLAKNSDSFTLCIGVAKINGLFESHAWIERNEQLVLNPMHNLNNFKKIFTYK